MSLSILRYHLVPSGIVQYPKVSLSILKYRLVTSGTAQYPEVLLSIVPSGIDRYLQISMDNFKCRSVPSGIARFPHLLGGTLSFVSTSMYQGVDLVHFELEKSDMYLPNWIWKCVVYCSEAHHVEECPVKGIPDGKKRERASCVSKTENCCCENHISY